MTISLIFHLSIDKAGVVDIYTHTICVRTFNTLDIFVFALKKGLNPAFSEPKSLLLALELYTKAASAVSQ